MTQAFLSLALVIAALGVPAAQIQSNDKAAEKPSITEATTDHLRIRYVNALTATADGSVALSLEITPRAGMHVYAPGVDNYQVVTMTIVEQRGIHARPVSYPPAEIYHFQPLNERIPVYQNPFKLTLDVRIEKVATAGAAKGARTGLSGRLDYQACDDKVCFAPVSVPLSWTVLR